MAEKMKQPRELFLHELRDMLYVERKLADDVLPKFIDEVDDEEFRRGLERHLEQTRGHAANLEHVFESLGEKPQAEKCIAFDGIEQEHDELMKQSSSQLVDLIDAGSAVRTEHYEMAAYRELITMANTLGETEAKGLFEENLRHEEAAAAEIEKMTQRLSQAQMAA